MTKEERKKAIDALRISAPVMAVTQEEFNDYIQTLNKIMNWLEQEPGHWIIMGGNAVQVYPNNEIFDKIKSEIENEKHIGFTPQDFADGLDLAIKIIDKYKAESEERRKNNG